MPFVRHACVRPPWFVLVIACGFGSPLAALAADAAEFGIRWDPAEGGPQSFEQVRALLQLSKGKKETFTVRYFSLEGGIPDAIARERSGKHGKKTMFKIRNAEPFSPEASKANWQCPFKGNAEEKSEVDLTWTAKDVESRKYSRSCEVQGAIGTALSPRYRATPLGCSSTVRREHANGLLIERWKLPGGGVTIEISEKGKDTPNDREKFEREVVKPLLRAGVRPLSESKTELSSRCSPH